MKINKKYILAFVIISMLSTTLFSQSSINKQLYKAFINNDLYLWKSATLEYEKVANKSDEKDLLQLINCYYGYTATLINKNENDMAKKAISRANEYIDKVLEISPSNAEAINYKGSFMSFIISMNKLKAIRLGKASLKYINKAYEIAPDNVQVLFDKGNALYYPPKFFGGNKKEAIKFYQKAISIIEQRGDTEHNWMYMQLLFLEAHCNYLMDNLMLAKKGYEKALKIEPDFKIVRDKYYPQLLKKLK